MATINNDRIDMHEGPVGASQQGNVFTNDVPEAAFPDLHIATGTLSNNGVGTYGTLALDEDGNYTYTLNTDLNYLGDGVDVAETFTYDEEYYDNSGVLQTITRSIRFDIHGQNDARAIADVSVSAYEYGTNNPVAGTTGNHNVLATLNPDVDFQGQLVAGAEIDQNDTDTFQATGGVVVSSTDVDPALLTGVGVTVNADGTYSVTGDFDALSEGDTATVTFQYQSVETNGTSGNVSVSDPKTVTMTVIGTDDDFTAQNDNIASYDQFLDGDIFKTILSNDGHAAGVDVNDKLNIISTGYRDIDFYNGGGEISVDNAARVLQYEPGGSDDNAIEAGHFKFAYQVSDGHNIHDAEVNFDMYGLGDNGLNDAPNANDTDHAKIDFYTIGDNASEHISGVHDKNNVVSGMGGNDHIHGQEKHDILYGGAGDDKLEGRWGNDLYVGGKGTDVLEDKRGHDVYVFSKGDGMDTIEDQDLEIYTDAMGHEDINITNFANAVELAKNVGVITTVDDNAINGLEDYVDVDTVKFDSTVAKTDIAIFQKDDGTLQIKYSDTDMVSVMWQNEDHYGIEKIEASDGTFLSPADIDNIINAIATTDIDAATAGIQTAQNIDDVRNSAALMAVIAGSF